MEKNSMSMTDKEKIIAEVRRLEAELRSMRNSITDRTIYRYSKKLISFIESLPEEPASEDLEEAAEEYCGTGPEWQPDRWQFIAGANWQKKQMMKGTLVAVINSKENDLILYQSLPAFIRKNDWHRGDKVKLIIVKEG